MPPPSGEEVTLFLHSFHTEGLSVNSYLIGDSEAKKAALIDPTRDIEPYVQLAKKEHLEITAILETHVHADFVSGSKELKNRLDQKPLIYCSQMGGDEWVPQYADRRIQQGFILELGSVRLQALHTPGHTPEHIVWLCFEESRCQEDPCLAFTGDLLFVGGVGRPDLLGEEETEALTQSLYHSLFFEMSKLPDFVEIFPAHGAGSLCGKGLSSRPSSTMGYERRCNPFLQPKAFELWKQMLQMKMAAPPINFARLKQINIMGPALFSEKNQKNPTSSFIIDLRDPLAFAKSHLKEAVNIPLGNSFCNWAASILPAEAALVIIGENEEQLKTARKNLGLMGFDSIEKMIVWNETLSSSAEILPLVNVETLRDKIRHGPKNVFVLDVRTPAEWEQGHIKEAHSIELTLLVERFEELPKDIPIYAICGSGYRSSLAASYLQKQGFTQVSSVWGGMAAWKKLAMG